MNLIEAIKSLNPNDDTVWTEDGLPSLSVIKDLTGKNYSRKQITDALPNYTRAVATNGPATPDPDAGKPDSADPEVEKKPEPDAVQVMPAVDEAVAKQKALDKAKAELANAERELSRMDEQINSLQARRNDVQAAADQAIRDIDNLTPKTSHVEALAMARAASRQQRILDAEQATEAPVKSPIDEALAASNKRPTLV